VSVVIPTVLKDVKRSAQRSNNVLKNLNLEMDRGDKKTTHEELEELRVKVKQIYDEQTDIRYGAARGWVDAIIQPHETRDVLIRLLDYVSRPMPRASFHTGVIQV